MSDVKKRRVKSRGNGTGTAYWSAKYRYWIAQAIVAWRIPEDEVRKSTSPRPPLQNTGESIRTANMKI